MKLSNKSISLHPKLAAGLDLFFGVIFVWLLKHVGVWWALGVWLGFRMLLWGVLIRLVYFSPGIKRLSHFFSLLVFGVGSLLLLMFMDWSAAWWVVVLAFVTLPAISFGFLPAKEVELSFEAKPYRRWKFLLTIFGLMGIVSGLFAMAAFQLFYNVNGLIYIAIAAISIGVISVWWWNEYGVTLSRSIAVTVLMFMILMTELILIVMIWPLGFLANGLIIVWWWYIGWLLVRFHLSKDGIVWKKQKWFLLFNTLAMFIFLVLVVRWK